MTTATAMLGKLAAVFVPLLLLARFARVFPSSRLLLIAMLPAAASLSLAIGPDWFWPVLALDALVVGVTLVDLSSLPRGKWLHVERSTLRVASLGQRHRVELTLSYTGRMRCPLELRDDLPEELAAEPWEFELALAPRSRSELHYTVTPRRRGRYLLERVHFRTRSRMGLWQRLWSVPCVSELHVYPDMQQLQQYALLARQNRLNLLGVRRSRRIGQDNEFERLRDYTQDDNFRHVDWRATARRRKLIVRDFQQNQSQRVVFLVDCGRMMTNVVPRRRGPTPEGSGSHEGLTFLDHAFNAALMMAHVALSRGDAVGWMTFSDEIQSFIPPRSGMSQMNRLLHASFDRFPQMVESRYDLPFFYLDSRVRKRSLVVLLTNVIDEVNAGQVRQHLAHVSGRHLPLGVLLRDRALYRALDDDTEPGGLYRAAAAAGIISWRHDVLASLSAAGALVLDAYPDELTAPLVNRYLEIKARHLL